MNDGMVSGICIDWNNLNIVLVPNVAPEKPSEFGLPGGIIGRNETPEEAMVREWREEVWGHGTPQVKSFVKIKRSSDGPDYFQHLFLVEDTRRKMRKSGVKGETKAPVRVNLWDIAKGNVEVFFSHKLALCEALKSIAPTNKEAAFLFMMLDRKMKTVKK